MKTYLSRLLSSRILLVLLIVVLITTVVWQNRAIHSAQAMPAAQAPGPVDPALPSPAATSNYTCTLDQITVAATRVEARCTVPVPGTLIWSFAVPTDGSNSQFANRVQALMTTSIALGKQVTVSYNTDITQNPTGCYTSTCRKLETLFMLP